MIRRPPRSTQSRSSAASDVYKRQLIEEPEPMPGLVHDDALHVHGARSGQAVGPRERVAELDVALRDAAAADVGLRPRDHAVGQAGGPGDDVEAVVGKAGARRAAVGVDEGGTGGVPHGRAGVHQVLAQHAVDARRVHVVGQAGARPLGPSVPEGGVEVVAVGLDAVGGGDDHGPGPRRRGVAVDDARRHLAADGRVGPRRDGARADACDPVAAVRELDVARRRSEPGAADGHVVVRARRGLTGGDGRDRGPPPGAGAPDGAGGAAPIAALTRRLKDAVVSHVASTRPYATPSLPWKPPTTQPLVSTTVPCTTAVERRDICSTDIFCRVVARAGAGQATTTRSTRQEQARALAAHPRFCLLYTSDAADDLLCVDLGGRRIIKKKKNKIYKKKQNI